MKREYSAAGPSFVLEGGADPSVTQVLTLDAIRSGSIAGRLTASRLGATIRLSEPIFVHPLASIDMAELLRLLARVASDFWTYRFPVEIQFQDRPPSLVSDALAADGFSNGDAGIWRRPPGLFGRQLPQAKTMEEVYQDLFSIPWNFVPRESDVYGPMIAEASSGGLDVLDLGCGLGKNVAPLEAAAFSVYGTDAAWSAIRRCREIVAHPHRFVVGSGGRLPWLNDSFDRVLDVGALHCMAREERQAAAAEIARVLKPGGLLYSRFFQPRGSAWLRLQPMQVSEFGMPPEEVVSLLNRDFECETIREEPSLIYVTARKRVATGRSAEASSN